jgi:hypothetical protein
MAAEATNHDRQGSEVVDDALDAEAVATPAIHVDRMPAMRVQQREGVLSPSLRR